MSCIKWKILSNWINITALACNGSNNYQKIENYKWKITVNHIKIFVYRMYNNDDLWNIDFFLGRSIHMQIKTHSHTQQMINQLFKQSERIPANLIKFPSYFPPIRNHFRLYVRQLHQSTVVTTHPRTLTHSLSRKQTQITTY